MVIESCMCWAISVRHYLYLHASGLKPGKYGTKHCIWLGLMYNGVGIVRIVMEQEGCYVGIYSENAWNRCIMH